MARPGWPQRNRAARSFRQLRRFHHVINSDKVFGTHRVARLGINHDRIETRADTSSLLNNCAPEFSIGGLHLRFAVPRWNLPGGLIRWLEHFRCRYFHRWRDVRLESAHRSQADADYPQAAHRVAPPILAASTLILPWVPHIHHMAQ